jgi:hypothetical protein
MLFVMDKDNSKLRQVLAQLKRRGIRLEGLSGAGGKYLFEDQNGKIYFIKNAGLMKHRPAGRKGIYKVWIIKVGDTDFDYLVCGLFKDGNLVYVTRAPKHAVTFTATMIMENRVRSRKGWDILYRGK